MVRTRHRRDPDLTPPSGAGWQRPSSKNSTSSHSRVIYGQSAFTDSSQSPALAEGWRARRGVELRHAQPSATALCGVALVRWRGDRSSRSA